MSGRYYAAEFIGHSGLGDEWRVARFVIKEQRAAWIVKKPGKRRVLQRTAGKTLIADHLIVKAKRNMQSYGNDCVRVRDTRRKKARDGNSA